jgi:SAM-dependent methyltransferase
MNNGINEIKVCEVCGNINLDSVLDLGLHPMCDDLVELGEDRVCNEYPIEILFCENCKTAHQRFQVPKNILFPSNYHYRSRFTNDVLNGMKDLVMSCEDKYGSLKDKHILDVGCNDGSLLDFFQEKGATTVGIEPTSASLDAEEKGHDIYNNYLSPSVAEIIYEEYGSLDMILFTNVFAHIEDLNEVLKALNILLSVKTVIVIENHYLGSILNGNQFDTFYHEHPRTYSYTSFLHIANKLNINLQYVEYPSRYGGNIRVFMGSNDSDNKFVKYNGEDENYNVNFRTLANDVLIWKEKKILELAELVTRYGPLKAKAFPGRAAILIKLLGLNSKLVSAVYEKPGSMKIGHYVPGTDIPILSDDELIQNIDSIKCILNFAWHISEEIELYLKNNNYKGFIVNILSKEDFAH